MKLDSKSKKKLVVLSVVTLLLVAAMGYVIYSFVRPNYAKEVGRPLEEALVRAGAVKVCETGDTGRGWDNVEPWYDVLYEVPGGMNEATELVKGAANQSGYNLVDGELPPSPEDNKFYDDNTSQESTYPDLEDGNVELGVQLYGSKAHDKDAHFCVVSSDDYDAASKTTTVSFSLRLPERK